MEEGKDGRNLFYERRERTDQVYVAGFEHAGGNVVVVDTRSQRVDAPVSE